MSNKSADAFRTISEVAEWLGVPTHVLRFWESRFSQVKPIKRAGGRRYYRPADMELLGGIRKLLHDDGMTIRGVKKLLRENGLKHVAALSPDLNSPVMKDVTPSNVVTLDAAQKAEPEDADEGATPEQPAPDTLADTTAPAEPTEAVAEVEMPEELPTPEPVEAAPAPVSAPVSAPAPAPADDTADMATDIPPAAELAAELAEAAEEVAAEVKPEVAAEVEPEVPVQDDLATSDLVVSSADTEVSDHTENAKEPSDKPSADEAVQQPPESAAPAFIADISHIPADPADPADPAEEADGDLPAMDNSILLALLQVQAHGGISPQNLSKISALSKRLSALSERMQHEKSSHPSL